MAMQNYISQLLTDMKAAEQNLPTNVDYSLLHPEHPAADYGLNFLVEYEMSPRHSMDDLFGIKAEQLPPDDKLTDEQVKQLTDAILELWAAYNIVADFPEVVPLRTLYNVLKDYWTNETTQYVSEGRIHLEFCHYVPEECPWGSDYCTCKEFANEDAKEFTPIDDAVWQKGIVRNDAGGFSWVNPELLDENGNFDPSKLPDF
jgi:hypothetical protein